MTIRRRLAAASLMALTAAPAMAQTAGAGGPRGALGDPGALEQLVVTASPSGAAIPTGLLGSSVTVVDARAVEARQARLVSDLLRDVPGVAVNRTGAVGGATQVRIRGGESNHTVVLVDGMLAADPGVGEFDFATLYADMGAHLEVLRGQQPIYGSNAISGVIHYITATGAEAPGLSARIEGGSFNSAQGAVRYGGVHGPFDVSLTAGYTVTDGTASARFGVRELDARNTSVAGKLILTPVESLRLIAVGRYAETYADNNPSDYASPPTAPTYGLTVDGTNFYHARQRMGLLRAEFDLLEGRWTQGLGVQGNTTRRRNFDDVRRPAGFTDAARTKYTYDSTLKLTDGDLTQTLTGVVDYDRAVYRNLPLTRIVTARNALHHINDFGLIGQYDLGWKDRLGLGAAIRHDDNTRFRNATSWRLQGSYRFDRGTRLHAAWGKGITNPTFIELYGFDPATFVGNPDLKPERSRGWEAGVEQTLAAGRVRLGATYFTARLRDEIYTVFTPAFVSSSANRATLSKQQGWELTAAARLGPQWRLDAAYTNLHAVERGVREIRRPQTTASLDAGWRSRDDRFGATATVRYNGKMTDSYFGPTTQTKVLQDFTLVNLAADVRLTRNLQIYGRVENLFDTRYEEVFGFASPGRAAYLGLKASL
jgi:vitamin B12 transporter